GDVVGRRDHGVDVRVRGVLLLEVRLGDGRRPCAGRLADLRVRTVVEVRGQHAVVSLREQLRVVVGGVPVHDQDVRILDTPGRDAVHLALPDELADLHVVEADVVPVGGT